MKRLLRRKNPYHSGNLPFTRDNFLEPVDLRSDDGVLPHVLLHNQDLIVKTAGVYSSKVDYYVDNDTERDALSPSADEWVLVKDVMRIERWNGSAWVDSEIRPQWSVPSGKDDLLNVFGGNGYYHTYALDNGKWLTMHSPGTANFTARNYMPWAITFEEVGADLLVTCLYVSQAHGGGNLPDNVFFSVADNPYDSIRTATKQQFSIANTDGIKQFTVTGAGGGSGNRSLRNVFGKYERHTKPLINYFMAVNHRRQATPNENNWRTTHFPDHHLWQRYFAGCDTNFCTTGQLGVTGTSGADWLMNMSAPGLQFNYPNERFGFSPTPAGFDLDADLLDKNTGPGNIYILAVMNRGFPHYNVPANNQKYQFDLPVNNGSPQQGFTFSDCTTIARLAFHIAARYGSKTVDPALITPDLYTGNSAVSGLNHIHAIELAINESSRHWRTGAHADIEDNATLINACLDGAMGTLGVNMGVRNADQDMKCFVPSTVEVMRGYLAGLAACVIRQREELVANNPSIDTSVYPINPFLDGNLIINIHKYVTDGNQQDADGAIMADNDHEYFLEVQSLTRQISAVVGVAVEVSITETGYSRQVRGQGPAAISNVAVPIAPSDGDVVLAQSTGTPNGRLEGPFVASNNDYFLCSYAQARALIRNWLVLLAAGISQCYDYYFTDVRVPGDGSWLGTFNTCGVVDRQEEDIKYAGYYVRVWIKRHLDLYRWDDYYIDWDGSNNGVCWMKFKGPSGQWAWIYWLNTLSDNTELISHFTINGTDVSLIEFPYRAGGDADYRLNLDGNYIVSNQAVNELQFTVTEFPQIILDE